MTPAQAREKAEELLKDLDSQVTIGWEDTTYWEDGAAPILARALLLAQAEALESVFGKGVAIECPAGISADGMKWVSEVLGREMDRIDTDAAALRRAAEEIR